MESTPLRIRRMAGADADATARVERTAFGGGWPPTTFERELANGAARYLVVETVPAGEILGFAGLWYLLDEAHVVTVAVEPGRRREGLGSLLVHALVALAASEGASVATLECRESNAAARALYGRHGFYEVGRRKRYYEDNGEDAIIMTTEEFESLAYQARFARLNAGLEARFPGALPDWATLPGTR